MYGERCEWVTGEEKKTFFLPTDEYILKETIVPKGYVKAKGIPFRGMNTIKYFWLMEVEMRVKRVVMILLWKIQSPLF